MKWANVLHRISKMTPAELDEEASVFNPRYGREFALVTLCERASLPNTDVKSGHVLVAKPEAVR